MNSQTRELWIAMVSLLRESSTITRTSIDAISEKLTLSPVQFEDAFAFLSNIGALLGLPNDEVARIASGSAMTGSVLAIAFDVHWKLLRVVRPEDLQRQLTAQLCLLPAPNEVPAVQNGKTEAMEAMALIGLSEEQLASAKQYDLSEHQVEPLRNMPVDFFPRAWKRAIDEGDPARAQKIVAVLLRLHDEQLRGVSVAQERRKSLENYLAFVESCCLKMATSEADRSREPIAESIRHEVWRRDQGKCVQCGGQDRLEFDHIIPWSEGGSNTARNLQLLCEICNRKKSNRI